jgi:hypothetical protein
VEICKNKKTDKVFIYLDEADDGRALMITPLGDTIKLERDLFTEPEDIDDAESTHAEGRISTAQYEAYRTYHQR